MVRNLASDFSEKLGIGCVEDLLQVEAVGWGGLGGFAVGEVGRLVEEDGEVFDEEFALGNFYGGAGEHADHFVEEAVAVEADAVAVGESDEFGTVDGAGVVGIGLFVSAIGGEGVEVVGADEEVEGVAEGVGIE